MNQFPLPLDAGGPLRFFGLTRALAAAHDVHVLALARPSTTPELVREMGHAIDGPVEVFQPTPQGGPASRWARALWSGVPTYVRAQYSHDLARRLRTLAAGAEAVVLLDDYAGGYAGVAAGIAPVVADKHNVLGASITLEPAATTARQRLRRLLAGHQIRRFERECLRQADRVTVTSEEESARLERLYGRSADAVVPSAVDVPPARRASASLPAVAWLGDHRYTPNVEGLVRFVREGWEPLGSEGARLLVAGANPPPAVRALEQVPGVELVGFVEPLEDLFERASAAVVPLWRGAGVKLKTLVFMAAGLPVAATSVAVEGVAVEAGRHCLLADKPVALADHLRRLLDDRSLAASVGGEGRRLVEQSYTWDSVGPRFAAIVDEAIGERTRS